MIFIRVRLNYKGAALFESLPAKIKSLLINNPGETFDIEVADAPADVKLPLSERELRKFRKSVQKFGPEDLTNVGELIRFKDDTFAIELKEDGSIEIHNTNESRIMNFKSFERVYENLEDNEDDFDLGEYCDMIEVRDLWRMGVTSLSEISNRLELDIDDVRQILDTLIGAQEIDGEISESLIRQHNLDQLKMLRKMTKGIDIGDRVPNMKNQGANIHFMHNPIDSSVESFEDFEKNNKGFIPSWNSTHKMGPFDGRKSS